MTLNVKVNLRLTDATPGVPSKLRLILRVTDRTLRQSAAAITSSTVPENVSKPSVIAASVLTEFSVANSSTIYIIRCI